MSYGRSNYQRVASPPVIWCLGDSRCHGAIPDGMGGFGYTGGWRASLYQRLTGLGITPTMTGTLLNSSDGLALGVAGAYHSGYNGSTAASWLSSYFATYNAALGAVPSIITISLGTNDGNSAAVGNTVCSIVDLALAARPGAMILVESVVKSTGTDYALTNAAIVAGVDLRRAQGGRVLYVNTDTMITTDDEPDGLHYSQSGYDKVGSVFASVVESLVKQ